MGRERRRGNQIKATTRISENQSLPEEYKKQENIYLDGIITHSCRGLHKVELENGLEAICTSSKMDHKRIGLLVGDKVTAEIPTSALSPDSAIRARIVWRIRSSQKNKG